jgi:hypothetical protein
MKKILMLVLMLGLMTTSSALGNEAITMQDVYDAHQLETLLASHESVFVRETWRGGENPGEYEYYLTDGFSYYRTETWSEYLTDNSCYYRDGDVYYRDIYITPDGLEDMASVPAIRTTDLNPATVEEEIQSVTEEDGRITVTSEMSQEKVAGLADQGVSFASFEYVLDAKTHDPLSGKDSTTYEDGTVEDAVFEYAYDAEMTEDIKALMALDRQTEDLRTVTLVFHPGTEEENTVSVQMPRGVYVWLCTADGINDEYEVYADAECTETYTFSEDNASDETLYIQWTAQTGNE